MHLRIAVMPGDGIGPELIAHGLRVLDALAEATSLSYELVWFPHSAKHFLATNETLGEDAVARLAGSDSLLFGAVGDPSVPPGLLERELVLGLSRRLNLWLGVRPVYLHHHDLSPMKGLRAGDINLVVLRETTEGAAVTSGMRVHLGTEFELGFDPVVHTRHGVERVLRAGFRLATERRGNLRLVAQSNVLASHQVWEHCIHAVAEDYPSVHWMVMHPDHAASTLVSDPRSFDVIVTDLLLGGLFSDLAGGLVGGPGLIGSARRNPESGFGMYEPAHGSAPRYAGLDRVSPMATLNAIAMLLHDQGATEASAMLTRAIARVLGTGDVGLSTRSGLGTTAVIDLVLAALDKVHSNY